MIKYVDTNEYELFKQTLACAPAESMTESIEAYYNPTTTDCSPRTTTEDDDKTYFTTYDDYTLRDDWFNQNVLYYPRRVRTLYDVINDIALPPTSVAYEDDSYEDDLDMPCEQSEELDDFLDSFYVTN